MAEHRYGKMRHVFDPVRFLLDTARLRAKIYPRMLQDERTPYSAHPSGYDAMPEAPVLRTETDGGTPIRKRDAFGRWYFMPVLVRSSLGELEFPCAVISVTGRKRIVETPLVGRRGSVVELVGADSYEIDLSAALIGSDGNYPEAQVQQMRDLYELNESVELVSALTDLVFEREDRVVFKSVEFPAVGAVENVQVVKMTARTDAAIELILE